MTKEKCDFYRTDLTNEEYRDAPGLSNSFLNEFDRSPAHAFTPREPSDAQRMGTLIHLYVLEPERFLKEYVTSPRLDKRTKEYKSLVDASQGKEIIFTDELERLERIRANVRKAKIGMLTIGEILDAPTCLKEVSIFWRDGDIYKKARLDAWYKSDSGNIILDLKKTVNANEFNFSVKNYKYYRQNAFYLDGIKNITKMEINEMYFVAVEDSEPYGVKVYALSPDYILAGSVATTASIMRYEEWQNNGSDKSIIYPDVIEIIDRPNYL